jgi:hypothetical protein
MQLEQLQQRARAKAKETDAAVGVGRLDNHKGYSAAIRKLEELSSELEAHIDQREIIKARSCRDVPEARGYIRNAMRMWNLTSEEIAMIARERIRTGKLPEDLNDPCEFIDNVKDPDARPVILKFDFERRAVEVLKVAVNIQRKTVATQKRQAVAEICQVLQPKYSPIARRVAEALLELGAALEEERAFCRQLLSTDAEIAEGLKPRAFFPGDVLSRPNLCLWLSEAMEAGLIDSTDPRASALGAASKATA